MKRTILLLTLTAIGLTGCLSTQNKTGLARPDFSKPAPVTSGTAAVSTHHCSCCGGKADKPVDLTTPPEPQKGKKIIGELPEYQDEDDGAI